MPHLSRLLEQISYESVRGDYDPEITDICYHSGKVKRGSLFVCINGQKADGHEYLKEVLAQGAKAIVINGDYLIEGSRESLILTEHFKISIQEIVHSYGASVILVTDTRKALAEISAAYFDYPAKKMRMIGITGTNGKTTTAYMIAAILRKAGYKTGIIGTIVVDDGKEVTPSERTTPEAYDLQKMLYEMVENGCDCCVMEVSSQGIQMKRTYGILFSIGIFLNIEPDHIGKGEHATFSEYLYCKSRLMRQCQIGIVNQDDSRVNQILTGHSCEVETFSTRHPSDVMAEGFSFYMEHGKLNSHFLVKIGWQNFDITMQLPGIFNIYNALAAISAVRHFRVSTEQMQDGLAELVIPGRCENLAIGKKYAFLIDYAHNEMSLRNLLSTLKDYHPGRLVVIFGCGGNRSTLRRARMGETAGNLADFTVITSDNPRWEAPGAIIRQIEEGMMRTKGNYIKIEDRREAVSYMISHALEHDIIILAGKGHEQYQEISGVKYPMDDRAMVAEMLQNTIES